VVPRAPDAYRDAHPSRAVLVVEIAETSYRTDREYKLGLYARAEIAECWLIDVVDERVEIHRKPEASPGAAYGWRYRSVETLRPPAEIVPRVDRHARIRVGDLLP